jgi:hypothetical protein
VPDVFSVTVNDADVLTGQPATVFAAAITTNGQPSATVDGVVANFTDSNTSNVAGDFTAMIAWGDGATSTGTVSGANGFFAVSGSHRYATSGGQFPVTVTLTDDAPGSASASATSTVDVVPAMEGVAITATSGILFDIPGDVASDWSATIDWGDGATSPGTVNIDSNGAVRVIGTHTYADEGSYSASATLTRLGAVGVVPDVFSVTVNASATSTVDVVPAMEGVAATKFTVMAVIAIPSTAVPISAVLVTLALAAPGVSSVNVTVTGNWLA